MSPPERFATLTEPLDAKDWVVYVTPAFAGPAQTLDDLGRSTHRVAISNNRIVEVRDGQVRFTSRNRRQSNQVQTMVLEAPECIRRFLLHVLPQGLQRMRHIGFLANRCKARALRQCRHLLGQSADPPTRCTKTVVEWMRQCMGTDITRCPSCGYGPPSNGRRCRRCSCAPGSRCHCSSSTRHERRARRPGLPPDTLSIAPRGATGGLRAHVAWQSPQRRSGALRPSPGPDCRSVWALSLAMEEPPADTPGF